MTELVSELRTRVEALIRPHVEMYGDDAPVVKMALTVLHEAEDIAQKLAEQWVSTAEAAERTGWVPETLQKYARAKVTDGPLPNAWKRLQVRHAAAGGYEFVIGTIPPNPRRERAA